MILLVAGATMERDGIGKPESCREEDNIHQCIDGCSTFSTGTCAEVADLFLKQKQIITFAPVLGCNCWTLADKTSMRLSYLLFGSFVYMPDIILQSFGQLFSPPTSHSLSLCLQLWQVLYHPISKHDVISTIVHVVCMCISSTHLTVPGAVLSSCAYSWKPPRQRSACCKQQPLEYSERTQHISCLT